MVTIKDISKKCGVSPSTVSKALNGYDDIGEETAQMIRAGRAGARLPAERRGAGAQDEPLEQPGRAVRRRDAQRPRARLLLFDPEQLQGRGRAQGYDITFISQNIGGAKMTITSTAITAAATAS